MYSQTMLNYEDFDQSTSRPPHVGGGGVGGGGSGRGGNVYGRGGAGRGGGSLHGYGAPPGGGQQQAPMSLMSGGNMYSGGGNMYGGGGGGGDWNMQAEMYGAQAMNTGYHPFGGDQMSRLVYELQQEEAAMAADPRFVHARKLIATEIDKITNNAEMEYIEIDEPIDIRITKKVLLPSMKNPGFNYVGKVLGPGGKTLQGMAKHFKCHFYVCGSGSTRDPANEQQLLMSGDPKYAHFAEPAHVRIECTTDCVSGYQRIAAALEAMSSILQPVKDDPVSNKMYSLGKEAYPVAEGWKGKSDTDDGSAPSRGADPMKRGGGGGGRGAGRGGRGRGRGYGGGRPNPY